MYANRPAPGTLLGTAMNGPDYIEIDPDPLALLTDKEQELLLRAFQVLQDRSVRLRPGVSDRTITAALGPLKKFSEGGWATMPTPPPAAAWAIWRARTRDRQKLDVVAAVDGSPVAQYLKTKTPGARRQEVIRSVRAIEQFRRIASASWFSVCQRIFRH